MLALLRDWMDGLIGSMDMRLICVNSLAGGIVCAIIHWLLDKDCIPPDPFISIIRNMTERATLTIYRDMKHKKRLCR